MQIYSHLKDVVDKREWMTSCCMHQTRSWFRISLEIECQKEPFWTRKICCQQQQRLNDNTKHLLSHIQLPFSYILYRLFQVPSKFTGTHMNLNPIGMVYEYLCKLRTHFSCSVISKCIKCFILEPCSFQQATRVVMRNHHYKRNFFLRPYRISLIWTADIAFHFANMAAAQCWGFIDCLFLWTTTLSHHHILWRSQKGNI